MTVICQETEGSGIIEGRTIEGRDHRAVLKRQLVLCTHQLRVIYTIESSSHWLFKGGKIRKQELRNTSLNISSFSSYSVKLPSNIRERQGNGFYPQTNTKF